MRLLTQTLKDGKMEILEAPLPALSSRQVLVRNHFSVISAGTESKTVGDARLGYIGKARARKKEVGQVIESMRTNGVVTTVQRVMNKLEAPSPLGYSCAGEVIAVADDVSEFKVGDFVACGGATAIHAEAVTIPVHLCTRVDPRVNMRHAAFTTLGAIALQGVRRAELGLGAKCAVIGLGLVGLLTVQLLHASGVDAIGIDIDPDRVRKAKESCKGTFLCRHDVGLEENVREVTNGVGVDAVIITAGTSSTDPINLAGQLCRSKGKVVIVGSVPTGFDRRHYYRKELDVLMSCSYGPGRYDANYEEKGIDYPIGYVRWTENRNMQAFVQLLATDRLSLDPLISHTFVLDKAPEAYQMILEKSAAYTGIVIQYDHKQSLERGKQVSVKKQAEQQVARIGFIGAGSFAHNILLPAIKGYGQLVGVATARSQSAQYTAEKYGFEYCTGNADDIINDERINTVFIVTRHHLHAPFVLAALNKGKHVYVEKPLCLSKADLDKIRAVHEQQSSCLMVGFNRRFAKPIVLLKSHLPSHVPVAINYRINAARLPQNHWVHDPEVGGGRIIGEVCHFVDLAQFLAGSSVRTVFASELRSPDNLHDTLNIYLGFENGSTASISYFSNGNKKLEKERLEVFCGGMVAVVDDFKTLTFPGSNYSKVRLHKQDKGHQRQCSAFLEAINKASPSPIPFEEIYGTTATTFNILESLRTGTCINA